MTQAVQTLLDVADRGPNNQRLIRTSSGRGGLLPRLCLVALAVFALIAGVGLPALLLLVLLTARQMPAATAVRRLALVPLALFGANAVVLTGLSVVGRSLDARVLVITQLVLVACLPGTNLRVSRPRGWATAPDVWALASALLCFGLYYRPFVGSSVGRVLAQLSYSTDSANHLGMVARSLEQQGYLAQSDYPPGWYGNVGVVVRLVNTGEISPGALVSIAAPIIVAGFALLTFFAVALILDVVGVATQGHRRCAGAIAATGVALTLLIGPSSFLLRSSSYTQLLSITALLAGATLVTAEPDRGWRRPVVMGLLCVSLMQTWYLLAPVLAVLVLLYLYATRPQILAAGLVALPTGLVSLYPLLRGPAASGQLAVPGATPLPPGLSLALLLLLALAGVALLVRANKPGTPQLLALATLTVSSLVLTVVVIAGRGGATTGIGYYGAKVLYVALLFGSLAATAAAALVVSETTRPVGARRWGPAVLAIGILTGLTVSVTASGSLTLPYAAGQTPAGNDGAALEAIFQAHPTGPPDGTDTWIVDGCSRIADHIASKWIYDLTGTGSEARARVSNSYRSGRPGDVSMLVARAGDADLQRMEVYVHRDCAPAAIQRLAAGSSKVVIVRVD